MAAAIFVLSALLAGAFAGNLYNYGAVPNYGNRGLAAYPAGYGAPGGYGAYPYAGYGYGGAPYLGGYYGNNGNRYPYAGYAGPYRALPARAVAAVPAVTAAKAAKVAAKDAVFHDGFGSDYFGKSAF